MELWYPKAVRNPAVRDGGMFESGRPYRGVLHTTESHTFTPSSTNYGGWHTSYPHFTAVDRSSEVVVYQHIPIDRASRALANPSGGVQTNRARAIQIEIVGKAAESQAMSPRLLRALSAWMRWVEEQTGMPRVAPLEFHGSEAYGTGGVARMSGSQWNDFSGWCGHQHVPENSHWDPGRILIDELLGAQPEPEPVPGPAPSGTRYRVVDVESDDVLNVRSGPGVNNPVVGSLGPSETRIVGSGERQDVSGTAWLGIQFPGGDGWASSKYLEPVELRPPRTFFVVSVADDDLLNLRMAPGVEHPKVGAIPPRATGVEGTGAVVQVGMAEWYEVVFEGTTGWCHGRYLADVTGVSETVRADLPPSDPYSHGYPDDAPT